MEEENTSQMSLAGFWMIRELKDSLHVATLHNKMELQKERIDTLLKWQELL